MQLVVTVRRNVILIPAPLRELFPAHSDAYFETNGRMIIMKPDPEGAKRRVNRQFEVIIPHPIRRLMNIGNGDQLEMKLEEAANVVVVTKSSAKASVSSVYTHPAPRQA